jgi:preprotein translocase subunit SecA
MMPGRRYSEGLHQALEAKEGVKIQPENQTLASITFQNYFRMYEKLAGMTGTAATEAEEFGDIYKLEVVEIPTNVPVSAHRRGRRGLPHRARKVRRRSPRRSAKPAKRASRSWSARPRSRSRKCSPDLRKEGIPHSGAERPLPRAGSHHRRAGRRAGAVTIATNMAGRGTDIQLGGNVDMRIEES